MNRSLVKEEYITGDLSLAQLSEKHDVPLNSLYKRSAAEGWVEQRERYREELAREVHQQRRQADLEAAAALGSAVTQMANWLAELVHQQRLQWQIKGVLEHKQLRELVGCARDLDGLIRAAEPESDTQVQVVFASEVRDCCG